MRNFMCIVMSISILATPLAAQELRIGTHLPANHPAAFMGNKFDLGPDFSITLYPDGSVVGYGVAAVEAVIDGIVDGAIVPVSVLSHWDYRLASVNVPFAFETPSAAKIAIDDLFTATHLSGFKAIGTVAVGTGGLLFSDDTYSADAEFNDITVGSYSGSPFGHFVAEAGGTFRANGGGIQAGLSELASGQIDAYEISVVPEFTKIDPSKVLITGHKPELYAMIVNQNFWNNLSSESQAAISQYWATESNRVTSSQEEMLFSKNSGYNYLNDHFSKKQCPRGCPKNGACSLEDLDFIAKKCCPKNGAC